MRNAIRRFSVMAAFALASVAVFGVDPPDLRINTVTGLIETVDATWSGSNFNVRLTEVTTAGVLTTSYVVTANAANDLDPYWYLRYLFEKMPHIQSRHEFQALAPNIIDPAAVAAFARENGKI